jgi:hypothetical protein
LALVETELLVEIDVERIGFGKHLVGFGNGGGFREDEGGIGTSGVEVLGVVVVVEESAFFGGDIEQVAEGVVFAGAVVESLGVLAVIAERVEEVVVVGLWVREVVVFEGGELMEVELGLSGHCG